MTFSCTIIACSVRQFVLTLEKKNKSKQTSNTVQVPAAHTHTPHKPKSHCLAATVPTAILVQHEVRESRWSACGTVAGTKYREHVAQRPLHCTHREARRVVWVPWARSPHRETAMRRLWKQTYSANAPPAAEPSGRETRCTDCATLPLHTPHTRTHAPTHIHKHTRHSTADLWLHIGGDHGAERLWRERVLRQSHVVCKTRAHQQ